MFNAGLMDENGEAIQVTGVSVDDIYNRLGMIDSRITELAKRLETLFGEFIARFDG